MKILITISFLLSISCLFIAQSYAELSLEEVTDKARNRLYDGGMDEESLLVQPFLFEPRRTINLYYFQKKILESALEENSEEERVRDPALEQVGTVEQEFIPEEE